MRANGFGEHVRAVGFEEETIERDELCNGGAVGDVGDVAGEADVKASLKNTTEVFFGAFEAMEDSPTVRIVFE